MTKCNLATEPPSLAYRLVGDPDNGCARIEWEDGPVEHTAASLLRGPVDDDERSERNELDAWLTDYLSDCGGSAPAQEVIKAARLVGYSENGVKKARGRIKARTVRTGFGKGASYTWGLDHGFPMDAMDSGTQTSAPMAPMPAPMQSVADELAPCGHPIKVVNTSNGKCGRCIAERLADPSRAAAEERGRALRLAVGA